jgi:hypothetical protein
MKIAIFGVLCLILIDSCAVYTFSPSALGGIKSVAVPVFDNQTTEYGLGEALSGALSQAFVADNTLKVMPEAQADAIMRGTVVSYSREAYTYTEADAVQEYICRIGIKAKFENIKTNKTIWEDNLSDFGTYRSADESEQDGKDRAVSKLIDQILNKTVKGW